jgi:hypothetical protein
LRPLRGDTDFSGSRLEDAAPSATLRDGFRGYLCGRLDGLESGNVKVAGKRICSLCHHATCASGVVTSRSIPTSSPAKARPFSIAAARFRTSAGSSDQSVPPKEKSAE